MLSLFWCTQSNPNICTDPPDRNYVLEMYHLCLPRPPLCTSPVCLQKFGCCMVWYSNGPPSHMTRLAQTVLCTKMVFYKMVRLVPVCFLMVRLQLQLYLLQSQPFILFRWPMSKNVAFLIFMPSLTTRRSTLWI